MTTTRAWPGHTVIPRLHARTYAHTHAHVHTHAHMHTRMHICTHTHKLCPPDHLRVGRPGQGLRPLAAECHRTWSHAYRPGVLTGLPQVLSHLWCLSGLPGMTVSDLLRWGLHAAPQVLPTFVLEERKPSAPSLLEPTPKVLSVPQCPRHGLRHPCLPSPGISCAPRSPWTEMCSTVHHG